MKFSEADSGSGHLISSYGPGYVAVDGRTYRRGLILSPEHIDPDWGPEQAADLTAEHFQALLELEPQVMIIGTGRHRVSLDPRTYLAALEAGLGVEVMDTGAACRTYNILASEGRKVVAGLLMYGGGA